MQGISRNKDAVIDVNMNRHVGSGMRWYERMHRRYGF